MSQRTLEAHYLPNRRLSEAHGLSGYNCGYAASRGCAPFAEHQQSLVWRLLGDTSIGSDTTVLDVGCGIGGPSRWIMERARPRRLIGVEFLSSSVRLAHERSTGLDRAPVFIQGNAQALPLADASVDVIFNLESALHYPDKRRFISECRRVLKVGGRLCLGDITTRHKRLFALAGLLNAVPTQFNSNVRLWSVDDYRRAFEANGLDCRRHEAVSISVADSLADGIDEVKARGWSAASGYRARCLYLSFLERLLRSDWLSYDLFHVTKPA